MKFRKVAMVFGAAVLSTSLFTACGNGDDSSDTPEENAAEENGEDSDAVSGASISDSADDLVWAMSAEGNWIFAATADITVEEYLDVDGDFHDKGEASNDLYRKLALYTQDDDRNVLDTFTLTVPVMNVNSPNLNVQEGTIAGDVHVNAEGFTLTNSTIDGNLVFASEDLKESANFDEGAVTGEVSVEEADAVSGASISDSADDLVASMSANGGWIFAATADITLDEDLTIAGDHHLRDDDANDLARKLALYTTDDDRNVDETFTLTVPTITVDSPNLLIKEGTVVGDITVNAEGFTLEDVTIDGNITFASEDLKESANLTDGEVTGEITVAE